MVLRGGGLFKARRDKIRTAGVDLPCQIGDLQAIARIFEQYKIVGIETLCAGHTAALKEILGNVNNETLPMVGDAGKEVSHGKTGAGFPHEVV